jgi:hypothetical protein
MRSRDVRCFIAVLILVITGQQASARHPRYLKNIGLNYGVAFRGGSSLPASGWELSYDRYLRYCIAHRPFWSVGFGRQEGLGDDPAIWSARFSVSPYHLHLSRRCWVFALASVRMSRWSTYDLSSDFFRPEVGVMTVRINEVISPRIAVLYGREMRIGGPTEDPRFVPAVGILSIQAGITVNIQTIATNRYYKRRKQVAEKG